MSNIKSALALGAAIVAVSVGSAFAAGVTTEGTVNVMSGPGDNYKIVGRLQANADVAIVSQSGDWCHITADALKGWVGCGQLDGAPTPRTDVAATGTKGFTGYNYSTDPVLGPNGIIPFHRNYNGGGN